MTLIEHIRELRTRLFRACLAVLVGCIAGYYFAPQLFNYIEKPYCDFVLSHGQSECNFVQLGTADGFLLTLKLALWAGLVISAPVWLYQLWAFIAPGLHRHERKWAYIFGGIAGPLFVGGAALAYFVLPKGLEFLLQNGVLHNTKVTLEVTQYTSFVTNFVLLFGAAFEFPVLLLLLNVSGVVTGKRMLGWWRIAVFLCFVFAAITTPDPGPFGMTLLAAAMSVLFFAAVGVAMLMDMRKKRKQSKLYGDLDDDEMSPLEDDHYEEVEQGEPIAAPKPIERRYDEMT
jgi:sec-independent protein translocase protein TatC